MPPCCTRPLSFNAATAAATCAASTCAPAHKGVKDAAFTPRIRAPPRRKSRSCQWPTIRSAALWAHAPCSTQPDAPAKRSMPLTTPGHSSLCETSQEDPTVQGPHIHSCMAERLAAAAFE
eukprot:scaffold107874_cov28-Tisochrysis_lutea.AAC.3